MGNRIRNVLWSIVGAAAVAGTAKLEFDWLANKAESYATLAPETVGSRNSEYLALDISKPRFKPWLFNKSERSYPQLVAILDLRMVGSENSEIPRDEQLGIGPDLEDLINECYIGKYNWQVVYKPGVENIPSYNPLIKRYNGKPATPKQLEIMKSLNFRDLLPFKPTTVYGSVNP